MAQPEDVAGNRVPGAIVLHRLAQLLLERGDPLVLAVSGGIDSSVVVAPVASVAVIETVCSASFARFADGV